MPLSFVALDFEMANEKRGSVIQLGITKVRDGVVVKTASQFICPHPSLNYSTQWAFNVHKIKLSTVEDAEKWPTVLEKIRRFAGDMPLVAHNASVERSAIVQASEVHGLPVPDFRYFCTVKLAKRALPDEPDHKLGSLSARLGLPAFDHHDAGADALASANLLLHIAERRGATDLDQLREGWLVAPKPQRVGYRR